MPAFGPIWQDMREKYAFRNCYRLIKPHLMSLFSPFLKLRENRRWFFVAIVFTLKDPSQTTCLQPADIKRASCKQGFLECVEEPDSFQKTPPQAHDGPWNTVQIVLLLLLLSKCQPVFSTWLPGVQGREAAVRNQMRPKVIANMSF